jgi:hypothetical protein
LRGTFHYHLAVSTGDDPTGGWCIYKLPVQTGPDPVGGFYFLNDFPRLGQDREAIYIASNLYRPGYVSEEVLALPKSGLYACAGFGYRNVTGFGASSGWGFTIQPANVFSPNDQPKSMYFVTSFCCAADNHLRITAFHDPFGTPTFTGITIVAANTYSTPPDATQQGTATKIATGDQRISGSPCHAAGSIYAALATSGGARSRLSSCTRFSRSSSRTGPQRWRDRFGEDTQRDPHGRAALVPQLSAQQPDGEGNVTTVFGFSDATHFASLAYASRRAARRWAPGLTVACSPGVEQALTLGDAGRLLCDCAGRPGIGRRHRRLPENVVRRNVGQ